jgi:hypothetical protein
MKLDTIKINFKTYLKKQITIKNRDQTWKMKKIKGDEMKKEF